MVPAPQDELDKLGGLEPVSPEFNITRTYLEWLISLPWGTTTQEMFDLARAKQVRQRRRARWAEAQGH